MKRFMTIIKHNGGIFRIGFFLQEKLIHSENKHSAKRIVDWRESTELTSIQDIELHRKHVCIVNKQDEGFKTDPAMETELNKHILQREAGLTN